MDYTQLSEQILELVGGKENVIGLAHCVTRLRFTLKDDEKVDDEAIKKLDGVMGIAKINGQYQVIVGNKVQDLYKITGELVGLSEVREVPKKKMKLKDRLMDYISAVMLPTIPYMCACGMIKALNVVLNMLGIYSMDSGIYTLLNAMGDTAFYFIPALFGYNAFKKLGGTPFLGLLIGAMLCFPSINGTDINLMGYNVNATYTSTVLPILVLSPVSVAVEKFLNKHLSESMRNFFASALVILITFPLGFAIIGPVSMIVSYGISTIFNGIYNLSPILAGIVLGAAEQFLVLFGLHFIIMAFAVMDVMQGIPSPIMALVLGVTPAVVGACLVSFIRSKDKKMKDTSLNCAIQAGVFGITEPATYGVLVQNSTMFIATAIGGAVGGAFAAIFQVKCYTLGGMGLLVMSIPLYLDPANPNMLPVIICMLAGLVVSFAVGMLIYREDGAKVSFKDMKKAKETK